MDNRQQALIDVFVDEYAGDDYELINTWEAIKKENEQLQKENEALRTERTTKNHYFCDCCKYKAGKTCLLSNNHCIRRATDYFTDSREDRNG